MGTVLCPLAEYHEERGDEPQYQAGKIEGYTTT